jgi:hypothetical protein
MSFEFVNQNSQNQFIVASGLDGFVLFTGHDVELVAENQDFVVFVIIRSAGKTGERQ